MKEQLEPERRFLLKQVPFAYANERGLDITQYYVDVDGERYRVRETYKHPGGMSYEQNYKETVAFGVNWERFREIDHDHFITLARKGHRMLAKKRILAPHSDGLKWEIDVLNPPKHLVMAEIEVPDMSYPLILPDFIQEVLIMEITGMKEFANYALADTVTPW